MQTWKTETWIRVEFTSGTDKVSVICAWHDGPPHVEVGNYQDDRGDRARPVLWPERPAVDSR